jgi:hypothetical protein
VPELQLHGPASWDRKADGVVAHSSIRMRYHKFLQDGMVARKDFGFAIGIMIE